MSCCVYVYCEGFTEESFVNEVLAPYLWGFAIYPVPIICTTSRKANRKYRGGVVNYGKVRHELACLCRNHKNELVTSMFDYYALPGNTPGLDCAIAGLHERMLSIEAAVNDDIGARNCMFHLSPHEIEGLLFSDVQAFSAVTEDPGALGRLAGIRESFPTPEHINSSRDTAPSKRVEREIPGYNKPKDGILVAKRVGIDAMLRECEHFSSWVESICHRCG